MYSKGDKIRHLKCAPSIFEAITVHSAQQHSCNDNEAYKKERYGSQVLISLFFESKKFFHRSFLL